MRLARFAFFASCAVSIVVAVACGSTTTVVAAGNNGDSGANADSGDAGAGDANALSAVFPAYPPADPPQVQTLGGPVLASPKIVPVFFSNDDPTTVQQLTDFTQKIGATNYWKANVTEYGSGPATVPGVVSLTSADDPASTIADSDIQAFLAAKLNANDPAWPAPDGNTVYALFYPTGVTISLGGGTFGGDGGADGGDAGTTTFAGEQSCSSFGGYHQNIVLDAAHGNMNVAYAVIPRCGNEGPLKGLDVTTSAASHEYIEATTDPYPINGTVNPAYSEVDDDHFYWSTFLGGGEIGDMCAQNESSFVKFPELPDYAVQRCWSNKAVLTGQDPCVPTIANAVYFNTVPVFKDDVALTIGGQPLTVKGAHIAVGASETVELDLSSTAATGAWTISAIDSQAAAGGAAQLKFDFDKNSGQNGDKVNMTITVLTAGRRSRETFAIISTLNGNDNLWIGVVGN